MKKLFAPQDSSMFSISSSSNLLFHIYFHFITFSSKVELKVQSSGGEKMLLVELVMLLVDEATTWLPTLQFELLPVSACKFCKFWNFKSFLDNFLGSGDDDDEEIPTSPTCLQVLQFREFFGQCLWWWWWW